MKALRPIGPSRISAASAVPSSVFITGSVATGFKPTRTDVQVLRPPVRRDRPHLERVLALLEQGILIAPPVRRFGLAEAAEAHRISEGRHLQGKLVFEIA